MLNNRRRATDAALRRARRGAAFSMLFALRPPHVVVTGFALVGLILIASRELAPHHWLGACYEAHLESRGGRYPGQIPVCVKHVPFAGGLSAAHAS